MTMLYHMRLAGICGIWRTSKSIVQTQTFIRTFKDQANDFTPRRAILYVPGNDERKLTKARTLNVDSIAMDCEDGVAVNQKKMARETIRKLLDTGEYSTKASLGKRCTEWGVRVNSIDSGLCEEDLNVVCSGEYPPSTILLPKVESVADIKWVNRMMKPKKTNAHTLRKYISKPHSVNLIMYAESCRSMLDLADICRAASSLQDEGHFKPVALVFGSDDFCGNIGATRTESATEVLYARQHVVLVAKAFNMQAIDMVYINYKDLENLRRQSLEGAQMGYTGKQIIHPGQIGPVQESYLPSTERVQWASDIMDAWHKHQATGKGAFVLKGTMIDKPTVRQAQNIISLIESVK